MADGQYGSGIESPRIVGAAPGDPGHQAGGRQPGERDHQFRGARSSRGIRKGGRYPPGTLWQAFQEIAREPAVAETLFEVLEAQRILAGKARMTLLPGGPHSRMLANLLAAEAGGPDTAGPAKQRWTKTWLALHHSA